MQQPAEQTRAIEQRLAELAARGVVIVDPRQTYVDAAVRAERIHAGAVLHPGTRLCGARSLLGPGAELGREGPVTAIDCVLGEGARLDGGYASGAVLLRGASAGSAGHLREGTLLEEEASTAHAVGLKHTILLCFVTIGSLVNFCDALVAGGTSRQDHSEIGSGYIHFNFTPWGARGDKATPSLIGDVPRGALLRERRVFLGGSGGMVGPRQVGFGAVAGAGQVLRKDVLADRLVVQPARSVDHPIAGSMLDGAGPRAARNARYLGELHALRAWYAEVRLRRAPETGPSGTCPYGHPGGDRHARPVHRRARGPAGRLPEGARGPGPAAAPARGPRVPARPDERRAGSRGVGPRAARGRRRRADRVAGGDRRGRGRAGRGLARRPVSRRGSE